MPILTGLRQSPTYLYIKVYCICSLVTLFQASPVTSRIPQIGQTLQLTKHRIITTRLGPRIVPVEEALSIEGDATSKHGPEKSSASAELVVSPSVLGKQPQHPRLVSTLQRWSQRAKDLSRLRDYLKADDKDVKTYPEIAWDATVRRSSALHPDEKDFIRKRREAISSRGTNDLHTFLGLDTDEIVDPDDVPLVAIGGSGGGYRAMYGFAAFISAAKRSGLWACTTWIAGVSGSCWTLAAYYTIAYQNVDRLVRHYLATASELAHPMSVYALDTVARSSRGVYFLIGPLIRKSQAGIVGLGVMDLYATLTTTYQLLSREPRARLSRATFQFSKIWTRSGVSAGLEPMPIFTAVRVAPKDASGVRPHADSSMSKGEPPKRALLQHQTAASRAIVKHDNHTPSAALNARARLSAAEPGSTHMEILGVPVARGYFQWFEASPLEIGSTDLQAFIPTWALGRAFVSGHSLDRRTEESMSLILGQCTSAPAGPLTGYISALLASLPKGTVMSRILLVLNNFVRMKRWERRWGNPIRAGDEPNPFYGLNVRPVTKDSTHTASVLGIGVDIMHMPRLDAIVSRYKLKKGSARENESAALTKLASRILSNTELSEWKQLCTRLHSEECTASTLKEFLAIRWAAKEAVYKALYPAHVVSWKDLSVFKAFDTETGTTGRKPSLQFSALGRERHPLTKRIKLHLSVSHDGEYAIANVVAEELRTDATQSSSADGKYRWDDAQPTLSGNDASRLSSSSPQVSEETKTWESQGRIRLMDAGMSNNLPNHVLARKERGADVIIAFDASSDVQVGSAIRRIENFADDCHIDLVDESHLFPTNRSALPVDCTDKARELDARFAGQYAKVFRGTRQDGSDFRLIYCPLLPNAINPDYDPSTSAFSNSYNLVWTPAQVKTLLATSEANLEQYALHTIKQVMRTVYEDKKSRRLAHLSRPKS